MIFPYFAEQSNTMTERKEQINIHGYVLGHLHDINNKCIKCNNEEDEEYDKDQVPTTTAAAAAPAYKIITNSLSEPYNNKKAIIHNKIHTIVGMANEIYSDKGRLTVQSIPELAKSNVPDLGPVKIMSSMYMNLKNINIICLCFLLYLM